jgi:hypothetical protein
MRFALFLTLALTATGCTSTHSIYRSEPGDIGLLHERMEGHRTTIELSDGTSDEGTVLFVRTDSTAWHNTELRRSVLTENVARMTRHRQTERFRNSVLIGGGVGIALAIPILIEGDQFLFDAESFAAVTVLGSLFYGAFFGYSAIHRRVYVLKDTRPTGLNY